MLKIFTLAAVLAMTPLVYHWPAATASGLSDKNNFFKSHQFAFKTPDAANILETKSVTSTVDTAALKQSSWYAAMMNSIEASEYNISLDDQSHDYVSPNRRQNLRGYYSNNEFTLTPRNDSADKWKLTLTLKGVFAGQQQLMAPDKNAAITQNGSAIQFNNNNTFTTEYVNNKEGIRQNFIIHQQPLNNPKKISIRLQANKGWYINKAGSAEIHFAKATKSGYQNKLTYNNLKVWDANHTALDASFSVKENTISIDVDTKNAVYPVTIDPLSTTPATIVESNQASAEMGRFISSAGDVNGDGYSDVIVGAWKYDGGLTDEGAAFIYHGSATGISTTPAIMLEANQTGASFGTGVSCAGDVNKDGYSDVIIGAYLYDNVQADEGAAFIYHGSATGIGAVPAAMVESNQVNAQMGFFTSSAGDVNGDGFSDIIVGANLYDNGQTDEGAAFIYHGSAIGLNTTAAAMVESNVANANLGREVSCAGDVNGDGYSDIIAGAYAYANGQFDEGAAFIYHGSAIGLNTTAALVLEGNQTSAAFGISVGGAGDVNGDGYSDVIVGAYMYDNGESDEGTAFIYLGTAGGVNATAAALLEKNQVDSRFGAAVRCAGDINGDGYSDVIVGAYFYDNGQTDEGAAFVYNGSATGISTSSSATVESNQTNAVFSIGLSSAGDVNGDGYSDILAGAFWYDNSETDEGAAFIYHGGSNGLSALQTRILSPENQNLAGIGNAVAGAGDVNKDGYSDVIISTRLYDDGGNADEGRAWVYYGSATGLSATPDVVLDDANQASAYFGYSVACAGDVNGDGYDDVIIGAYNYSGGNTGEGRAWVHYGSAGGLSVVANRILDDANQDGAGFGASVAGAGDVNGDGYADVIVGAYSYDDGANTNEGRAFVYYGSAAGLAATPSSTPDDANQASTSFGGCVSSAGDVNGDGYSDVAICAGLYDDGASIDEGVVFIYYGGITGLAAAPNAVLDDGNQAGASFGRLAAGAGDVNGDGYADVLVTSILYDGGKGRGWVYYGSAVGLSAIPDVILDNTAGNTSDVFSYGASSAGDVNGDGYSDIIVGMPQRSINFTEDGQAYIYYGSATGLSATPGLIIHDATESHEFFGLSTACAGDINGDGYSDVIIGADHGSYTTTFGGRAYIHNGNELITNKRNNLQMYNSDLTTPINNTNFIFANFGAGLYAKSFLGRTKGKMVWETRINYHAYSGAPAPITNSTFYTAQQAAYADLGLTGVELKDVVNKVGGAQIYTKLRARVKYDPVTAITGQVYGPWRYVSSIIDANKLGALPIELISFKAAWLQKGKTSEINFVTDKEAGICCFTIEKSADGFNFKNIGTITAKNTGSRQSYHFTDINANGSKQFYRLKITGTNSKTEYSNILQLRYDGTKEIWLFPNPAHDVLQLQLNGTNSKLNVQIVNSAGQTVKQLSNMAVINQTISIPVNNLPAGQYWLKLQAGEATQILQFIKQ